jgi:hypothetical protein
MSRQVKVRFASVLIQAVLAMASLGPAEAQQRDARVAEIERAVGQKVFLTGPTAHLRLGASEGTLYIFKYGTTAAFNAWFFSGPKKYVLIDQSKFDDDIRAHSAVSIFDVKSSNADCLAILQVTYLWQQGVKNRDTRYGGDVYCLSGDAVVRDAKLSRLLENKRTERQARKAFAGRL